MEEDVKIFGYLQNLIEIPADNLLYWTLKAIHFQGTVSDKDIEKYRHAISRAYKRFRSTMTEELAFHFPYEDNYQNDVFEKVVLPTGEIGFKVVQAQDKNAKELLEYRLVKLETFSRMQRPVVREMFELAEQIYKMEQPTISYVAPRTSQSKKQKVLQFVANVKNGIRNRYKK